MTAVAHLNSFYSAAPIVLWVEDAVTRDYLAKIWGDPPEIAFFIAGNNTAIRPVVETAERESLGHVFGLIDRDFGHTNQPKWADPTTRRFYLPRHEMENYSLDAVAIHGCSLHNRNRTVADIESELKRFAGLQPAWLACRRILTDIRANILQDFPSHPNLNAVQTLAQAESHITESSWFTQLGGRTATWTTTYTNSQLQTAETEFRTALANGSWVTEFSGKEIFRRIREYVYQPRTVGAHDSDFSKAIGEWQLINNLVPTDLTQLRIALRQRVGLP